MLILCVPLAQNERVVEKDDFAVDVLDKDPKRLSRAMYLLTPTEIGDNSQVNTKETTSNRLDLC